MGHPFLPPLSLIPVLKRLPWLQGQGDGMNCSAREFVLNRKGAKFAKEN
jgi:hypothetical protein